MDEEGTTERLSPPSSSGPGADDEATEQINLPSSAAADDEETTERLSPSADTGDDEATERLDVPASSTAVDAEETTSSSARLMLRAAILVVLMRPRCR